MPEMGVKTKYAFLIINQNITEIKTARLSHACQSDNWDNICKLSPRQWHCQGEKGPQVVKVSLAHP